MFGIRSRAAAFVGAGALALGVPALAGAAVGPPGVGVNTGIGVFAGAGVNAPPSPPGLKRGYGPNPYDPYHHASVQGWNRNNAYGHGMHGYGSHGYGRYGHGNRG